MENKDLKEISEYIKLAEMIRASAQESKPGRHDGNYIHEALLRLFYIKSIENKLENRIGQYLEDTDVEIMDAVSAADEVVKNVSDIVFEQIEDYAGANRNFEIQIENTKVDLESVDAQDLLNQLYRCEGILRMAQRAANRYAIYGSASRGWERLEGIDEHVSKTPEEKIFDELGIDVYELFDVRKKLIELLEKQTGAKGNDI